MEYRKHSIDSHIQLGVKKVLFCDRKSKANTRNKKTEKQKSDCKREMERVLGAVLGVLSIKWAYIETV